MPGEAWGLTIRFHPLSEPLLPAMPPSPVSLLTYCPVSSLLLLLPLLLRVSPGKASLNQGQVKGLSLFPYSPQCTLPHYTGHAVLLTSVCVSVCPSDRELLEDRGLV